MALGYCDQLEKKNIQFFAKFLVLHSTAFMVSFFLGGKKKSWCHDAWFPGGGWFFFVLFGFGYRLSANTSKFLPSYFCQR